MKQHLANGNLLVTRTDVYSNWHPIFEDNQGHGIQNGVLFSHAGQTYKGGHAMTIVGYDDGRHYVDGTTANHGAFLICNSWGDAWGTFNSFGTGGRGFMWVAYDYFRADNDCFGIAFFNDDRDNYRPQLYAVVGINHAQRGRTRFHGGVGTAQGQLWSSYYPINPLSYDEGQALRVDDSRRLAVDLTQGIPFISNYSSIELFARLNVSGSASSAGSITSADFFHDFDGDGSYASVSSTDPTVTVNPGNAGFVEVAFIAQGNRAPVLSNPRLSPSSGNTGTTFEYLIDYYDADGDAPDSSYRTLCISSGGSMRTETMSLKSGTAANGTYRYTTTLNPGAYRYYFIFADGHGRTAVHGWHSGPTVYSTGQAVVNVVIQCTRISSDMRLKYSLTSASGPWTDLLITKAFLDPLLVPAGAQLWFQASVATANYEYREWEGRETGALFGGSTSASWSFILGPSTTEVGLNVYYRFTPQYYNISGTVLRNDGNPVPGGVDLVLTSPEQTASNHVSSSYSFSGIMGGVSVSITPATGGYQFSPANLVFLSLNENKSGQNFTAYSSDDYAPMTTIQGAPLAVSTSAPVLVTWSGTDDVTASGDIQYQWKLDDTDADWSAWGSATSMSYNLPNGAYTFWVRGKDEAGNINQSPSNWSFVVNAAPLVQSAARINRSVWATRVTLAMPMGATNPTNAFVLLPGHSAISDPELVPVRIHRANEETPYGANEIVADDLGLSSMISKTNSGWRVFLPALLAPGQTSQYDIVWGKIATFGWQNYVSVPLDFPNVGQDYPLEADSSGIIAWRLDDDLGLWRLARKYRNPTGNVGDSRTWAFLNARTADEPVLGETILQHEVGHPFDGSIGYGFDFNKGTILKRSDRLTTFWFDHKGIYDGVHDYSQNRYHTQVFAEDGSFISDEHGDYEARYGVTFPEVTINGRLWLLRSTDAATASDPAYLRYQVLDADGQTLIPTTDVELLQKPDGDPFYTDYRAQPIGDGVLLIWGRYWNTPSGRSREEIAYQVRDNVGNILKATAIVAPVLDESISKNDHYGFETVLPDGEGKVWVSYFHSQSGQPKTYHYFILDSAGDIWTGPAQVPARRSFEFCDMDGLIWAAEGGNLVLLNPNDTPAIPPQSYSWIPSQRVGALAASVDANGYRLFDRWSPVSLTIDIPPGAPHQSMELMNLDLWGNGLNPTNVLLKKEAGTIWSEPGTFTGRVSVSLGGVLDEGNNTLTMTQSGFLGGQVLLTFPYLVQHTISAAAGANGRVEPQGMVTVSNGANQVFAITPESYFHVADVIRDDLSVGAKTSHTFTNVTTDHSLLATFAADMATNSTPIWWLAENGLTNGAWDVEAMGDQDHDGILTWQEHQADTHPQDALSVLRFLGLTASNGQVIVEWQGGQAVRQYLESCAELSPPSTQWECIFTNDPITAVTNSRTHPINTSNAFFRIKAGR